MSKHWLVPFFIPVTGDLSCRMLPRRTRGAGEPRRHGVAPGRIGPPARRSRAHLEAPVPRQP